MKIAELRAKSKEELSELVLSLKKEQFNLRMQRATGALENQGRFKEMRRTIARANTLMNEKPGMNKPAPVKQPKAPKEKKAAASPHHSSKGAKADHAKEKAPKKTKKAKE